jgi:septum formation protein
MTFHTISTQNPLILASASPRRKRLLAQVGLPFRSMSSHVPEHGFSGAPAAASIVLAEKKARQVHPGTPSAWTLGADTIVTIDDKTLGKPKDAKEASHMLSLLSGREHRVITGFCVLNPSGIVAHSEAVITRVRIKELTAQEIESYISTHEPYGKAGSYAIQGIGSFMVESISGSYSNVVGLPLCALIKALVTVGALESFPLPNNL